MNIPQEIHVTPREAKEIKGWLGGAPSKAHKEGELLRSMSVEFDHFPEKLVFAIMNGKRPYVDRFVQTSNNGFEDDQKPTTRLFGEHCFHLRGNNYVVTVVTPRPPLRRLSAHRRARLPRRFDRPARVGYRDTGPWRAASAIKRQTPRRISIC